MFALKDLLAALGSPIIDCRQDGATLDPALGRATLPVQRRHRRASSRPTRILLVGTNPRREAAVLNARIRKRWRRAACRSA